jgi:hypothetical protein
MKKLLALVLCIVMVLSLAPAAFAAVDQDQPLPTSTATAKWASTSVANKAISNAKKNIEYMYGGMAADTAVFGTIQAMDSIVVDLAKGMFEGIDEYDYISGGRHWYISNSTLVDNTKALLRNAIGGEVADYMNKHAGSYIDGASTHWTIRNGTEWFDLTYVGIDGWGNPVYTDPSNGSIWGYQASDKTWYSYTGTKTAAELTAKDAAKDPNWAVGEVADAQGNYQWFGRAVDYRYDPIKYANTFATAVTKALSSEKGAANLSAYMYALMQMKVADQISDDLDDFWTAVRNWEDGTAILDAYGFAEAGLDPYAFIDPYNLPKTSMDVSAVIAPATRDYWLPVA